LAGSQDVGGRIDHRLGDPWRRWDDGVGGGCGGRCPGGVGGQDQRGDAARGGPGGRDGGGGVGGHAVRVRGGPDPVAERTGGALDVRGQRGVVVPVVGRVVPDDVDHRG